MTEPPLVFDHTAIVALFAGNRVAFEMWTLADTGRIGFGGPRWELTTFGRACAESLGIRPAAAPAGAVGCPSSTEAEQ